MNKKAIIVIILILAAVAAGFWYSMKLKSDEDGRIAAKELAGASDALTELGKKLADVSLLAPKTALEQSMDANFAELVSPELLNRWKKEPASAPGRLTSSPWPDHIVVTSAVKNADGTFTVKGNVVEVTSEEMANGGVAAEYTVKATIESRNGKFIITAFEKGPYLNIVSIPDKKQ